MTYFGAELPCDYLETSLYKELELLVLFHIFVLFWCVVIIDPLLDFFTLKWERYSGVERPFECDNA